MSLPYGAKADSDIIVEFKAGDLQFEKRVKYKDLKIKGSDKRRWRLRDLMR